MFINHQPWRFHCGKPPYGRLKPNNDTYLTGLFALYFKIVMQYKNENRVVVYASRLLPIEMKPRNPDKIQIRLSTN